MRGTQEKETETEEEEEEVVGRGGAEDGWRSVRRTKGREESAEGGEEWKG